ncbi:protein kinase [Nonomuraea sp. NPDC050663]|uniref:serine/threonine-protein kinase n=1 Tax=Nonomuraea sp. NPDC050663 TaxID=3364370 RepID=UPI00378BCEA5
MVPGYREVRQLGAGRTGRVFLATYQETGAYVAIKYLNAALRRDPEFMSRFTAETPRLVEVDDENVVRFYEYVETPTRAAVVMELVDGVSLRTLLAEHGRTSPEAALAVLKGTLLALAAGHAKGVAHRDVKPENVLVQADGTSKLGDFGVVGYVEEPNVPQGSPPYMAPELWLHTNGFNPRADLYAAACQLFECVMGRVPYRGTTSEIRDRHLHDPVPLELVPDMLRDLLRRGLAKDAATRYGSATEFLSELEEDALAGYGPEWEKRGRRHLAELATLLALRFPLAAPDNPGEGETAVIRRGRSWVTLVPRLPPHLWIAGGAVVAMLVALLVARGTGNTGPILMPPPESPRQIDPTVEGSRPPPTDRRPSRRPTTKLPVTSAPPTSRQEPPTSGQSQPPPPPATSAPTPTPTRSSQSAPARPAVRAATILGWSGSAGAVRVTAAGTGPVQLKISYTRREEGGTARVLGTETRTLTGETSYTQPITRDLGDVACGGRAYFGIIVATVPVADNGPEVSEAPMDGPPCPTQEPTGTSQGAPSPTARTVPSPTPEASTRALPTAESEPTDVISEPPPG